MAKKEMYINLLVEEAISEGENEAVIENRNGILLEIEKAFNQDVIEGWVKEAGEHIKEAMESIQMAIEQGEIARVNVKKD